MRAAIAGASIAAVVAGCARDVHVHHPRATPSAGTVEVVLNGPSRELTIAVDGALVVDRAHSRRARIDGVPAGAATVEVATGGGCEAARSSVHEVEVVPGEVTTIALPGPETALGCWIYQGLYYVGLNVGLVAIALLATAPAPRVK